MISPSSADSSSRLVSCASTPFSPVSASPPVFARSTSCATSCSSRPSSPDTGFKSSAFSTPDIMSVIRCTSMIGSYTARFTVPEECPPYVKEDWSDLRSKSLRGQQGDPRALLETSARSVNKGGAEVVREHAGLLCEVRFALSPAESGLGGCRCSGRRSVVWRL